MNILIIEDEKATADLLQDVIKTHYHECQISGIAHSTQQALKICYKTRPDIIIMDITLGHSISFELFEYIDPLDCTIIFLCSHKEFAFQAVQYGALAYILKPVNKTEIIPVLERALKQAQKKRSDMPGTSPRTSRTGVIYLYENYVRRSVDCKSLIKIKADGSYSWAYLDNGKTIHLSRHLKYYEDQIKEYGFIRTHKTTLTNAIHITEYIPGNNPMIRLTDGSLEPLSRNKRQEIIHLVSRGNAGMVQQI